MERTHWRDNTSWLVETASVSLQKVLNKVNREWEAWAFLLEMLPLRPRPRLETEKLIDGWMDGLMEKVIMCNYRNCSRCIF